MLFELAPRVTDGALITDLANKRVRFECPSAYTGHGPLAYIHSWSAEWARIAQPVIQPSHKFAASLMATSVPPVEVEIRPPWKVFYLGIPDGLGVCLDDAGTARPIEGLLVYSEEDHWTYLAHTPTVEYSRIFYPRHQMADEDVEAPPLQHTSHLLDVTTMDERSMICCDRLLLNACLAMSDPRNVRQIGKGHSEKTRQQGQPRIFELSRPVTVDCRQEIKHYIGTGKPMSAKQWLVRGHWRQQPHGPERAQRRTQWIEPFWKGTGPLQGPREHRLK